MATLPRLTPFIGRGRELALLTERLHAAGRGEGGIVLISGEAGVGKTRLLRELAERARTSGWRVLAGRAYETEGLPPYLPFIEALSAFVRAASDDELRGALGGGASDVALLVPDINVRFPDLPAPVSRTAEAARYQLFESVAGTLLHAARSNAGLLLVVDDLQWADRATLLLLEHVTRRLAAAPLLVAVVYRSTEVDRTHPLTATLAALNREGIAEHVALAPFTIDETAAVVEATTGVAPDASVVGLIHRLTAGNAFFVGEVARHLRAEGRDMLTPVAAGGWEVPESVRQVIGGRLARLGAEVGRMLEAAAVLGDGFTLDVLGATSGIAPAALMDALDEALRAGMLRDDGEGYRFSHDLIRQTLYDELPLHRRQSLHLRAAQAIERVPTDPPRPRFAAVATHFRLAGTAAAPQDRLASNLRAAEAAESVFAWEESADYYRAALDALVMGAGRDETQQGVLLLAYGEAQRRAGDLIGSVQTFFRAAEVARRSGATDHLIRAALGVGESAGVAFREPTLALLEEALSKVTAEDSREGAQIRSLLAEQMCTQDDGHGPARQRRGIALSREGLAMARRLDDPVTTALALNTCQWTLCGQGDLQDRLTLASELLACAERITDREWILKARRWRVVGLIEKGDVDAADAEIAAFARLAAEFRRPLYTWYVDVWQAGRALLAGDFAACEDSINQVTSAIRPSAAIVVRDRQLLMLRREQGRLDEVEQQVRASAEGSGGSPPHAGLTTAWVWLLAHRGRDGDARPVFARLAADDFAAIPEDIFWLSTHVRLAEVCALLNDADHAPKLYRRLLPYAQRAAVSPAAPPGNICYGAVSRYLGMLARTMQLWEEAGRHFADALAMHERMGARPLLAHTRHEYAAMLLGRNQRGDLPRARELLTSALATYDQLGMSTYAAAARTLLADSHLAAPQRSAYPDGLSARELEVLRLLTLGKSNPEIAAALVISLNTVYRHVNHIFTKLSVDNRVEAATYAQRHGLV